MKTQIILRIILIVIALFIFTNNTGSSVRTSKDIKTVHLIHAASSESDSKDNKSTQHDNNSNKENPAPYIPDTHHDHDFDCFDFKHHEKRIFWRCIANKAFAVIYHLTVLCALVSQFFIQ